MKHFSLWFVIMIALYMVFTVLPGNVQGQDMGAVQITEGNICTDVRNRVCHNSSTRFIAPVDQLFCFTKIVGAQDDTYVTHVWYFGETERARVRLAVRGSSWRTWSSKTIQPHEIGDWHVDVLGEDGRLLMVIPFEIHY
jgi:hypothetical protein